MSDVTHSATPDPIDGPVRQWVMDHHHAVLVTVRKDGSPQSSNVSFTFDGRVARISVTDERAKTRNVRRDPRVMLHVLGDNFWQYAAVQATAEASTASVEPGDAVGLNCSRSTKRSPARTRIRPNSWTSWWRSTGSC